jgi:hypothetical protein
LIFENFAGSTNWTKEDLDQFVGQHSVLFMMNNTFGFNVAKYLGANNAITPEELSSR